MGRVVASSVVECMGQRGVFMVRLWRWDGVVVGKNTDDCWRIVPRGTVERENKVQNVGVVSVFL